MIKIPCRECEAIELEYRWVCLESWANTSVGIREAGQILRRLAGGTEDDVVRLEELPRPDATDSSKMAELLARRVEHWFLAGHFVNLPKAYRLTPD
jgi:hypothetical protein